MLFEEEREGTECETKRDALEPGLCQLSSALRKGLKITNRSIRQLDFDHE